MCTMETARRTFSMMTHQVGRGGKSNAARGVVQASPAAAVVKQS